MNSNVPRSDVGGGGIAGALTVVIMLILQGDVYDFEALVAAIAVIITFAAPYVAPTHKSIVAAITTPVATVVAAMVGMVFFNAGLNKGLVSAALASLTVALITYLGRPTAPDNPTA